MSLLSSESFSDLSTRAQKSAALWDERYAQLKAYKAETGNLHIRDATNPKLRVWCSTQRESKRDGSLQPRREELLNALGFEWTPVDTAWEGNFATLVAFLAVHGNISIAYIKNFDKDLSIWVNRQKGRMARGEATPGQASRLQEVGLAPAVATHRRTNAEVLQSREDTLAELAAFRAQHGHVQINPDDDPESLFLRVRKLRHIAVARDEVLRRRLIKLKAFETFPNLEWETKFAEWKAYTRETGDYQCKCAAKPLKRWYEGVSRCLLLERDPLSVPIQRRYLGTETPEFKNVLRAAPRLHSAGFNRQPGAIAEASLRAAKLAGLCGITGEMPAMRTMLKVLSSRAKRGRLLPSAEAQLRQLGYDWDYKRSTWQARNCKARMAGALIVALPQTATTREAETAAARLHRTKPVHAYLTEQRKQVRAAAREATRLRNVANARAAIYPSVVLSSSSRPTELESALVAHMGAQQGAEIGNTR